VGSFLLMETEEIARQEALLIDAVDADLKMAIKEKNAKEVRLLIAELKVIEKHCIPSHRKRCKELVSVHRGAMPIFDKSGDGAEE